MNNGLASGIQAFRPLDPRQRLFRIPGQAVQIRQRHKARDTAASFPAPAVGLQTRNPRIGHLESLHHVGICNQQAFVVRIAVQRGFHEHPDLLQQTPIPAGQCGLQENIQGSRAVGVHPQCFASELDRCLGVTKRLLGAGSGCQERRVPGIGDQSLDRIVAGGL